MEQLDALVQQAWEVRRAHFADEIFFDFPTLTESITLTGQSCALNCAHCGGHYLKGMRSVPEIKAQGSPNSNYGFRSALISGGCTLEGKVPFTQQLDFLHKLKQDVRLNFHVGLLDGDEILLLKDLANVVS
ncbi:MAG TPA: radical SAM protein, partial [Desulfosporosinus sp.]|nr:radical SAM protein [Desulfosporosinus sp.]